jgi:hypothetical protein
MTAPRAFISYSHDSAEHKAWTLKLASDLRMNGIDVVLDQWDLVPGQDVSLFMQKGISEADRVLMICSSNYVEKAEAGVGGVGFERLIVTVEVIQSIDTIKFVPIVRGNRSERLVPSFLGPRLYVDFRDDTKYDDKIIELAREIHGAPAISKPPLGSNPFSGIPIEAPQARAAGPTGTVPAESRSLENSWFASEYEKAQKGLSSLKLSGHMEIRFRSFDSISKSQIELLNAVKQSEIRTFGWPIGITLENREEYRPRPYGDGIRAEISIGNGPSDRLSYDYWALRSNGDFYLLQSLFEDSKKSEQIFFDTRIVRVTECLMFAESMYTKLGAPPETRVEIQVSHRGLKGRTLTSASPNRGIREVTTKENESTSKIVTVLGTMRETRVEDVRKILEPMFMLFDFMQFHKSVFEDLVRNFERGEVR